jgi:hypothetical protein
MRKCNVGMWDDYWIILIIFISILMQGKFYFIPYDYDNTLGTSLMTDSGIQIL